MASTAVITDDDIGLRLQRAIARSAKVLEPIPAAIGQHSTEDTAAVSAAAARVPFTIAGGRTYPGPFSSITGA
jgi:hypothetical protein